MSVVAPPGFEPTVAEATYGYELDFAFGNNEWNTTVIYLLAQIISGYEIVWIDRFINYYFVIFFVR